MKNKHIAIELSIDDIKKEKEFRYLQEIDPHWFDDCSSEFYRITYAYGDLKLMLETSSIFISGKFSFTARHTCSRCGDEFEENITEDIYELCKPNSSGMIDVFPVLRELVVINEPIKILCHSCRAKDKKE
ncbi:MAG: YceD family protein [Elusimicrobiales bacterium]